MRLVCLACKFIAQQHIEIPHSGKGERSAGPILRVLEHQELQERLLGISMYRVSG